MTVAKKIYTLAKLHVFGRCVSLLFSCVASSVLLPPLVSVLGGRLPSPALAHTCTLWVLSAFLYTPAPGFSLGFSVHSNQASCFILDESFVPIRHNNCHNLACHFFFFKLELIAHTDLPRHSVFGNRRKNWKSMHHVDQLDLLLYVLPGCHMTSGKSNNDLDSYRWNLSQNNQTRRLLFIFCTAGAKLANIEKK